MDHQLPPTTPGFARRWIEDYDLADRDLSGFPKPSTHELTLSPAYDLGGMLPSGAKTVLINDYLPDGTVYVTENQVILSARGWDGLVRFLRIRSECNVVVRRIVERELGDVLAWLREAGHDV